MTIQPYLIDRTIREKLMSFPKEIEAKDQKFFMNKYVYYGMVATILSSRAPKICFPRIVNLESRKNKQIHVVETISLSLLGLIAWQYHTQTGGNQKVFSYKKFIKKGFTPKGGILNEKVLKYAGLSEEDQMALFNLQRSNTKVSTFYEFAPILYEYLIYRHKPQVVQ